MRYFVSYIPGDAPMERHYCDTVEKAMEIVDELEFRSVQMGPDNPNRPFVDVHLSTCENPAQCTDGCAGIYP